MQIIYLENLQKYSRTFDWRYTCWYNLIQSGYKNYKYNILLLKILFFNKLTIIVIITIISITSTLVFVIPADDINVQSAINHEKSPVNHTLSLDQLISISEANNQVAINLFKLLETDTQKNIFFSPFSILTAMTIEYEGARGNTALEMEKALGISSEDNVRRLGLQNITDSLTSENLNYELNVANALWIRDNYKVRPEYADIINIHYDGVVDSFNSKSADKINKWANDSTRGKIPEIISKDALSDVGLKVIITNAVYFNASWMHEFDVFDTKKSDFWINDKKSVDVDMMEQVVSQIHYTKIDNVQILKIPYKSDSNRLSMIIALPEDRDGIEDLENNLTYDMFTAWTRNTEPHLVQMYIPKFKIETQYDGSKTIPAFKNLGISDAFNSSSADLSGMTPETATNLYISDIVHNAFVNVDEIGTEAAAITMIYNSKISTPVYFGDVMTFRADHPFIFTIWDDETNTILFMGKISDPTA